MPDRYDPKLSVRPFGDRRPADPESEAQTNPDDPLAELARIVSGRAGADAPHPRPRTTPTANPPAGMDGPPASDPMRDLEAELLSDLQASFGAVNKTSPQPQEPVAEPPQAATPAPPPEPEQFAAPEPVAPEPVPPQPAPQVAEPEPQGASSEFGLDELLRELQAPSFGEPSPPPPAPEPAPPVAQEPPPVQRQQPVAAPEPPYPTAELPPQHPADPPAPPQRTAAPAAPPIVPPVMSPRLPSAPEAPRQPPAARAAPQPAAPRPSLERAARPPIQPPPAPPETARPATGQTPAPERPSAQGQPSQRPGASRAAETPSVPRPQSSRWEKPPEAARSRADDLSRFAPPGAAAAQPRLGEASDDMVDEEDLFVEDAPFLESGAGDEQQDDLSAESLDMVPGYGDDDQLLPFPEEELDNLVKRRSHRGLALVAVLLAVVLVGSVAVLMFRSGGTDGSAPPIIAADGTPTKVTPEVSTSDDDSQSKLIYDRVDSGESETDTTLLTFDDQPMDIQSGSEDNAISRVIIPGGPGVDGPLSDSGSQDGGTAAQATSADDVQPIGPRRVRTVVVKPDGTIVSSEAAAVDGSDSTAMIEETNTFTETETVTESAAAPNDDTAAIAAASGLSAGDELAITDLPEIDAIASSGAAVEAINEQAQTPAQTTTTTQPEETIVATGGDAGPIDVTPGEPARAAAPAPAQTEVASLPPGAFLVQVSSQRSEDSARATYRDLQARYPAILGSYQPIIQRADLGDRGIYFRVRIGPFAGGDAELLCNDLKNAGGDCILARN